MKIIINDNPKTRWEIAAKAAHDLIKRHKWIWSADRVVSIPEELIEDTEQIIRIKMEEGRIVLIAHRDTLETVIDWLNELCAWGFKHQDFPVPETGIPEE